MIKLPEQFEDPDQREFEFKISKTILAMPEEVQDRFKAIKVLQVRISESIKFMLLG
jgi:hypothetical protein